MGNAAEHRHGAREILAANRLDRVEIGAGGARRFDVGGLRLGAGDKRRN